MNCDNCTVELNEENGVNKLDDRTTLFCDWCYDEANDGVRGDK